MSRGVRLGPSDPHVNWHGDLIEGTSTVERYFTVNATVIDTI